MTNTQTCADRPGAGEMRSMVPSAAAGRGPYATTGMPRACVALLTADAESKSPGPRPFRGKNVCLYVWKKQQLEISHFLIYCCLFYTEGGKVVNKG